MTFYCALNSTESIAWQDGEQTINPETGEITPISFMPDFVCEWDGVSHYYIHVWGALPSITEAIYTDEMGSKIVIPAHQMIIPYAGWPVVSDAEWLQNIEVMV